VDNREAVTVVTTAAKCQAIAMPLDQRTLFAVAREYRDASIGEIKRI